MLVTARQCGQRRWANRETAMPASVVGGLLGAEGKRGTWEGVRREKGVSVGKQGRTTDFSTDGANGS